MRPLFQERDGRVAVGLSPEERDILQQVPGLAGQREVAGDRLHYRAHPDDEEAEGRYQELIGDDLDRLRDEDLAGFGAVVVEDAVDPPDLEAFARVVGEARLVLAARLGIEADGWEEDLTSGDPEMALLVWLGHLQDSAVRTLTELL